MARDCDGVFATVATIKPMRTALILVVPLYRVVGVESNGAAVPGLVFPELSTCPFLFRVIGQRLGMHANLLSLDSMTNHCLVTINYNEVRVISVLVKDRCTK